MDWPKPLYKAGEMPIYAHNKKEVDSLTVPVNRGGPGWTLTPIGQEWPKTGYRKGHRPQQFKSQEELDKGAEHGWSLEPLHPEHWEAPIGTVAPQFVANPAQDAQIKTQAEQIAALTKLVESMVAAKAPKAEKPVKAAKAPKENAA